MTDKTKELSNLKRKVTMSTTQLSKSRKALETLKADVDGGKPTVEQVKQAKAIKEKIAKQQVNLDNAEQAYKEALNDDPSAVKADAKEGLIPKSVKVEKHEIELEPKKEVVKDEPKIETKTEEVVTKEVQKEELKPETTTKEVVQEEVLNDETWLRDYGNLMIQNGHSIRTVISRFLTAVSSRLTPQECLREYKRFDDPVMCVKRAYKLHIKDLEQGH